MDRIQGSTATPDHKFTEGNPSTAVPATIVSATWLNGVQEELIALIVAAGLTPDQATLTQVRDALAATYAPKTSTASRLTALESTAATLTEEVAVLRNAHTYRLTPAAVDLVDGTPSTFSLPALGYGAYLVSAGLTMVGGVPSTTGAECGQSLKMQLRKDGVALKMIEHEWYFKVLNHYGGISQSMVLPPTVLTVAGPGDLDILVSGSWRSGFTSMRTTELDVTIQGITG